MFKLRMAKFLIMLMILIIIAAPLFARGGGGGGKSKGGSVLFTLIFSVFYGIYFLIWGFFVWLRKWHSEALAKKVQRFDPTWELEKINSRVEETYYALQHAWSKNDLRTVANMLSGDLLLKYTKIIDRYKLKGERNVLEVIDLISIELVGIDDREGYNFDNFMVLIKGSMVDYMITEATGDFVPRSWGEAEKDAKSVQTFWEIWTFSHDQNGNWLLSDISENTGILDILHLPCETSDNKVIFSQEKDF